MYSATLDAYNFANEGSKSVGPDLLVSFHGHDNHYNSVRRKGSPPKKCETNIHSHKNDKEKKKPAKEINDLPPPSERTSVDPPGMRSRNGKSRETAERSGAKMEKILIDDKSIKRNDPCPCGSNLKYKKCCLAKQKLDRRERERTQTKIKDEEEEASDLDAQRIASSFQTVTI